MAKLLSHAGLLLLPFFFLGCTKKTIPPNVLLIWVDDLRPELGCYGADHMQTPHIDALAASGTVFLNSYCNIPVCGASRASVLTGLRPTLTRFKRYYSRADEDAPDATSLPALFQNSGYYTVSRGKISHHQQDNIDAWDEISRLRGASPRDYRLEHNIALDNTDDHRGMAFEIGPAGDTSYVDGRTTMQALRDLRKLADQEQPFFLAVGYLKPHLPFNAPARFWDLYPSSSIALPDNAEMPEDVPSLALHTSGELRHYSGIPETGPVSDSLAKDLIRGYYACVSYCDFLIGKLLDGLEDLGLRENTVVVLMGDHGYNLLEHGLWCKHSNYRTSLQSPIIISAPSLPAKNRRNEIVEFVDIYPTLRELAGLPDPGHLEGLSLVRLLSRGSVNWKKEAVSVWKNGFTQTTNQYAYTKWINENDSIIASMLFDHQSDPAENANLIGTDAGLKILTEIHVSR